VYNDEPLDHGDYSGNVPAGSPVIYKEKGKTDVGGISPKKARVESKQAMETIYAQEADIVDSKWDSETLDAQQKVTLESKQEEGIGVTLQEVTVEPKQQEERVSASEDITVEPNTETEIVNDGAGHLEDTENAISEKCDEVIESLRKEVSNQLNSLYLKFLKRNPGYDGKVMHYETLYLTYVMNMCDSIL